MQVLGLKNMQVLSMENMQVLGMNSKTCKFQVWTVKHASFMYGQ